MGGHIPLLRGPERQPIHGVDTVVAAIKEEAEWQRGNPPSGDPIISTMWDGLLSALDRDDAVRELVASYAASQSVIVEPWTVGGVPISEVNGLLRTAIQLDSIRDRIRFPDTRLGWVRQLRGLANDPHRSSVVQMVLSQYHTMTASGERFGPFEVGRQLKGGPGGFLDAASSIGIGARQTQLKDRGYPFAPVRLLHEDGRDDVEASSGYARLVGAPVLSSTILLTDLLPPNSRLARRLSLASLRPSEIMDSQVIEQRRQLLARRMSNVVFMQSDLTDRASMGAVREYCRANDIRMAFVGTVLNIVGQEMVDDVIDNVLWALPDLPDSEIVVADFAQIDRRKPHTLSLLPRWGEASYGYFSIRKRDRERVNQLFEFTNSRPRVGRAHDGLFASGGELRPMRELLAMHATGSLAVREQAVSPPTLHMLA